jgi:hypothetical protein
VSVFLWQADGPRQGGRGISGDQASARRAAEGRLHSGQATAALIEEAVVGLGTRTLTFAYYPTGPRWRARVGAPGHVTWEPAGTAAR